MISLSLHHYSSFHCKTPPVLPLPVRPLRFPRVRARAVRFQGPFIRPSPPSVHAPPRPIHRGTLSHLFIGRRDDIMQSNISFEDCADAENPPKKMKTKMKKTLAVEQLRRITLEDMRKKASSSSSSIETSPERKRLQYLNKLVDDLGDLEEQEFHDFSEELDDRLELTQNNTRYDDSFLDEEDSLARSGMLPFFPHPEALFNFQQLLDPHRHLSNLQKEEEEGSGDEWSREIGDVSIIPHAALQRDVGTFHFPYLPESICMLASFNKEYHNTEHKPTTSSTSSADKTENCNEVDEDDLEHEGFLLREDDLEASNVLHEREGEEVAYRCTGSSITSAR